KEEQMSVCQRCHAQGVAILKEGKEFDDFLPGKPLSEVMDVFLPRYGNEETGFIMASHADRTAMSACYKKSAMTCITCHNPHVSVKETPIATFNAACINCHGKAHEQQLCSLPINERLEENDNNCSSCHMPVSTSIDIPHVTIHDHFIRKPITNKENDPQFKELARINGDGPVDPLTRARAFLKFYESFQSDPMLLDSVQFSLNEVETVSKWEEEIQLAFLQENYSSVRKLAANKPIKENRDPYTYYRIGESFFKAADWASSEKYFLLAVEGFPLYLDFQNKLGSVYSQQRKFEEAEKVFSFILSERPTHLSALSNLGFIRLVQDNAPEAKELLEKAIAIDPDYVQALLNLAAYYYGLKDREQLEKIVERVLQIEPNNDKALKLRGMLGS
ncbi:tetratricopeptide repeat protein, partial [Chitinophagales bacterium]|nr:tetratricopeptide repeat protein [Chitinophagales bacterium]